MAMPIEMGYTNTVPVESELEYPNVRPAPPAVSFNHRILPLIWLIIMQSDDKFRLAAEQGRMPPQTAHQMPPPAYTSSSTYNSDTHTSGPSYASEYTSSPVAVNSFSPMSDVERYPQSVSEMTSSTNATGRGYVMSDEERYPTVVESPEIHQAPEFHSSSTSVTMLQPPTPPEREPISPLSRNMDGLYSSDKEAAPKERRKYCGLSRTIMLCIVAGVLLVIIGLSVGLGLWAKSKNKTKRLPAITSSGVWTNTNQTHWFSQIYSTNKTTGQVMFSLSEEPGSYIPAQAMNLTIMPEIDAPMAAVAKWGSDALVYLNLFYIKDQYIVTANVSCIDMSCTTISNEIIQQNLTYPIADDSGLSAVYISDTGVGAYKVFYHNTDRYITQLSSEGGGVWNHGDVLSAGKSLAGSKIAATAIGTNGTMALLYVDAPSKTLYQIYNQDNRWRNRKFKIQLKVFTKLTYVLATPVADDISKWDPTTSFTSTYVPKLDSLRCYFVGSDRLIYEFTGRNASTSTFAQLARGDIQPDSTSGISTPGWKQETYHDLTWLKSDSVGAEITSTSWDDQIRYYRLVEKTLAVSSFKNGVWSAKLV